MTTVTTMPAKSTTTAPENILMVSYTSFLQRFYQSLPQQIALQGGQQVDVLVPPYWKEMWSSGKVNLQRMENPAFDLHVGNVFYPGNLHFAFFLNLLGRLLKQLKPAIIDLEDEPFNLGSLQMVWYRNLFSPDSKLVLHASQYHFKRYPPPFNLIEKYVLKNTDAVFVRNSRAGEVLRQKGFTGLLPLITHGVDIEGFRPGHDPALKQELSPDGKSIVGFVGTLEPHKGVDTLLQAMRGLPARTLIIGTGSMETSLRSRAAELQLDALFLPPQEHQRIAELMACMDIFVLPSISLPNLAERFGRVIIEAMACGAAVVASDCGEIPVVVANAGIIFPEKEHQALQKELQMLLDQPEALYALQQKGRKHVEKNYSWQAIAGKTLDIYRELLRKNKAV